MTIIDTNTWTADQIVLYIQTLKRHAFDLFFLTDQCAAEMVLNKNRINNTISSWLVSNANASRADQRKLRVEMVP